MLVPKIPLTVPAGGGPWGVAVTPPATDGTPPQLTVPATITVKAQSLAGTRVTYTATATDNADPTPDVVCTPPSGTDVHCTRAVPIRSSGATPARSPTT